MTWFLSAFGLAASVFCFYADRPAFGVLWAVVAVLNLAEEAMWFRDVWSTRKRRKESK